MARSLAIFAAIALHLGFVLFGGLLVGSADAAGQHVEAVDLLASADVNERKPEPEKQPEEPPPEPPKQAPPDASAAIQAVEQKSQDAPALDALSLGALEQALNGKASGDALADALSLASGGRIGGTGKVGIAEEATESAFSMSEIDQTPRAVLRGLPLYPSEMRGKNVEGLVSVIFTVDATGRVTGAKIEKASHPAFERPALEAVRQWKFEPAIRAGQRVACRMRSPVRFQKG